MQALEKMDVALKQSAWGEDLPPFSGVYPMIFSSFFAILHPYVYRPPPRIPVTTWTTRLEHLQGSGMLRKSYDTAIGLRHRRAIAFS